MKGFEERFEVSTLGRLRAVARVWAVGASTRRKPAQLIKEVKPGLYRFFARMQTYSFTTNELKQMAEKALTEGKA